MFTRNNFFLGLLTGAVLPVLSWLTFHIWYSNLVLMGKPVVPYFTAILINLLLIRAFHHHHADKTVRGIMLVSFIFLVLILLVNKI